MVSLKKAMAVIRQARFFFSIAPTLAIPSAFVAVGNYNLTQLFLVVLSFLLVWAFMCSVNNTYDIDTDRISPLRASLFQNPIVTGELSFREARVMNLVLPVLSVAVAAFAGPYWIGLPLITIPLVVLYDIKPFRFKDRASGFLIVPFCHSLPFYFAYATATSSFALPPWALYAFAFFHSNGINVTRYLPDTENDLKLGIRNFSATYGAESSRRVDTFSMVLAATIMMTGIFLGGLSPIGIPLLLISVAYQLRTLSQSAEALKEIVNSKRLGFGRHIFHPASMALSMIGLRFAI